MREEFVSNKKSKVYGVIYGIFALLVLIVGIASFVSAGFSLSTFIVFIVFLLIVVYLAIDSFMYYRNFHVTLTDDELILKDEYGKIRHYSYAERDKIFITKIRSGPIIVLGKEKYFVYGNKVENFSNMVSLLDFKGVLDQRDIEKANTDHAEELKNRWGRVKSKK